MSSKTKLNLTKIFILASFSFLSPITSACSIDVLMHNNFLLAANKYSTFESSEIGQKICRRLQRNNAGLMYIGGYADYPGGDFSINITIGIYDTKSSLASFAYSYVTNFSHMRAWSMRDKEMKGGELLDVAVREWYQAGYFDKAIKEFDKSKRIK